MINCRVRDNAFLNAYVAMDLGPSNGFNRIERNGFCVFSAGILILAPESHAESWILANNFSYAWG